MNDVVLVGGNHHNGLGLVRSFGRCGIKPYGVIIKNNGVCFADKSKYWKKTWVIESEEDIPNFLLNNFADGTVIIPYSDRAISVIDQSLDVLKIKFILPSIALEQGQITKLQNKYMQIKLADKYGIPIANSQIVNLPYNENQCNNFIFPCILKPVMSSEGDKRDIVKCDNIDSLLSELAGFYQKGYNRALVQEYIDYDYEFLFCGSCGNTPAYLIRRNIRNWPVVGGTASFGQCLVDTSISEVCEYILKALKNEGYNGLFDIEMFKMGDRILLNEINWRNTGACFFCKGTGVEFAVIWYLEMIGEQKKADSMKHFCKDSFLYQMNEATDLRHVFYGSLSFMEWIKDVKKCTSFALWYKYDMKPVVYQYFHLLCEMIRKAIRGD